MTHAAPSLHPHCSHCTRSFVRGLLRLPPSSGAPGQAGYTAVVAHLEVGVRPICAFPKAWAHKDAGEQVPCRMQPDCDGQSLIPIYDRDRCNPIITTTLAPSHLALTHTHANARIDAQARPSKCALRKRFEFTCAFVRLPSHSHMQSVCHCTRQFVLTRFLCSVKPGCCSYARAS